MFFVSLSKENATTGKVETYLDGEKVDTQYINSDLVGFYRIGGIDLVYFNGLIDDVRIYNRALSAVEIEAIYNSY